MAATNGLFWSLSESGVVEDTGNDVTVTDEFDEEVDRLRDRLASTDAGELTEHLERSVPAMIRDTLQSLAAAYPDFVASLVVTVEHVDGMSAEALVQVGAIVQQLRDGFPETKGTPERFFPVTGDQLEPLLELNERAVVYVWRDECEPCEGVRDSLEEIFDDRPDDVALLSVYGPDCSAMLQHEYDVVGAPTVLFVLGGTVDSRLQQVHPTQGYEQEIELLRQQTTP